MIRFFRSFDLTDSLSFTCALLSLPYFFVFNFFGLHLAGNLILIFVGLFLLPLVFRRLYLPNIAKATLVIVASGLLFLYSLLLGKSSGAYLVFISIVPLPILLLENKKSPWVLILSAVPISAAYCLEFIHYQFYFTQPKFTAFTENVIHSFALSTAFSFVLLSTFLFYFSNRKILQELSGAYEKISVSNVELEQSNTQLQQAYDDLKKSKVMQEIMSNQAAYSQLVNGIAHEFKNPLHLMRARAEVTLEKTTLDPDERKMGEAVIKQVDRLDAILKPMLVYGRQNMGGKKTAFDLKEIVDDLSELAAPRCKKSRIHYYKPDPDHGSFMAFADKDYVFQSVLNIFVNALQFTPQGGEISLNTGRGQYVDSHGKFRSGVWVSVKDTGEGIPADKLATIFEPYSTSKKDPKNVGLGLSIVFRAITENDGKIDVESEVGKGTLFRMWVPAA